MLNRIILNKVTETMTKRQASNWGKRLFFLGFYVLSFGAIGGLLFLKNIFIIPGIGFALILLSFGFLAYGSRVGDERN